jgi:hypothetical protein
MDQIHSRETCELLQEHLFPIVVTLIPIILDLWVEEQHTVYKSRTHLLADSEPAKAYLMQKKHQKYQRLLDRCSSLPPTPTAVAHPCDETSLKGAVEAAELHLLIPILVGPRGRIESVAKQCGIDAPATRSWTRLTVTLPQR